MLQKNSTDTLSILLLYMHFLEHTPRQPVILNLRMTLQAIPSQAGKYAGPKHPIDAAEREHAKRDYNMQPVRQILVRLHAWRGWDERCDGQEDVGEEKEEDNGPRGAEGRSPIEASALGVRGIEEEQAGGDEGVDDRQRIRYNYTAHVLISLGTKYKKRLRLTVQNKVEGIAGRRCKDGHDGDEPVQGKSCCRSVEWFIRCPEL